jgi:spore germination cell wall hydrolase CwlJ-like protein
VRRRLLPRFALPGRKSSLLPPFVIGLGIWIGFPTASAYQDMRSLVAGSEISGARWSAFVEKSVAGSVHEAELAFDSGITGSVVSSAGIDAPGIGAVAFRGKGEGAETPDEERINRAGKRGRIVKIVPVAPPKAFSAGSVFERSSSILQPHFDAGRMAFAVPEIKGKEIAIAAAFHPRVDDKPDPQVPAMLASLVNNEKADVLATAYAPPPPDYAEASPFDSLLKPEEKLGRFIPPVGQDDHDWMKKPLPAHVFSAKEQKCLATAIYFEARGEPVKGQAAVAQVVLNRVRAPTYPDTICGVVYQNDHWRNRCQFSFACDGIKDRITSTRHYKTAEEVALAVTAGKIFIPEVGSSTHYHATYVRPGWAGTMEKMKKIGLHIFYRTYGGGWS